MGTIQKECWDRASGCIAFFVGVENRVRSDEFQQSALSSAGKAVRQLRMRTGPQHCTPLEVRESWQLITSSRWLMRVVAKCKA